MNIGVVAIVLVIMVFSELMAHAQEFHQPENVLLIQNRTELLVYVMKVFILSYLDHAVDVQLVKFGLANNVLLVYANLDSLTTQSRKLVFHAVHYVILINIMMEPIVAVSKDFSG